MIARRLLFSIVSVLPLKSKVRSNAVQGRDETMTLAFPKELSWFKALERRMCSLSGCSSSKPSTKKQSCLSLAETAAYRHPHSPFSCHFETSESDLHREGQAVGTRARSACKTWYSSDCSSPCCDLCVVDPATQQKWLAMMESLGSADFHSLSGPWLRLSRYFMSVDLPEAGLPCIQKKTGITFQK